ncbi:hypothetical protein MAR_037156, partial [Mya arenaria]
MLSWNSTYSAARVMSVTVVSEEEVVTADRTRAWKISYNVDTSPNYPPSTARNTRALSISTMQNNIIIPTIHGGRYTIANVSNEVAVSQTYGAVLSERVYNVDISKMKHVLATAVSHSV